MRPLVLLDCDGILCHFTRPVLDRINLLVGNAIGYTDEDVTQWDMYQALGVQPSIGQIVDEYIRTKGFCASLEPYPDAIEWLPRLREIADVHVVTSPFDSDYWAREREQWLAQHFGFTRYEVTQTGAKNICFGDFLVDDKDSTIVAWGRKYGGYGAKAILFDRPWNRSSTWQYRANDWPHLVAMIRAITEG